MTERERHMRWFALLAYNLFVLTVASAVLSAWP